MLHDYSPSLNVFIFIFMQHVMSSLSLSHPQSHTNPYFTPVLSGVDDGADIPREMVAGIYERIQQRELRSNEDHVTYVTRVEQNIQGMKTVSLTYILLACIHLVCITLI